MKLYEHEEKFVKKLEEKGYKLVKVNRKRNTAYIDIKKGDSVAEGFKIDYYTNLNGYVKNFEMWFDLKIQVQ